MAGRWLSVAILLGAALLPLDARAQEAEAPPVDRSILISLSDRRLYLIENGERTRSFPVAIGRPGVEIPLGDSTVVRKRRNPTWRPTANQRRARPSLPLSVPPGPDNPLGRHALDLGWSAIAIHGTNEPDSVGRRASSGCFRMMPADIETLFGLAEVGTPVRVVRDSVTADPDRRPPVEAVAVAAAKPVPPKPREAAPASAPPPVARAPAPVVQPVSIPAPLPPPPPPVIADPRCPSATAPVRRMICDTPELAVLDGRARGAQLRFLEGLADRSAASYALIQDERRFEDRIAALCWIRKGTETDPAVAAKARACLSTALSGRLEDVGRRIAELRATPSSVAARP